MTRIDVDKAVEHFAVPKDKEEYLFLLPGLYVGAADGNLDKKEVMAVAVGAAVAIEVLGKEVIDPEKAGQYLGKKTIGILRRCNLGDVDILMEGIRAKLEELPRDKASMIRGMIRVVITIVAGVTGRKKWILWGNRIDKNESQMIARIASYL